MRNPPWGPRNKRSLVLEVLTILTSSVFPSGNFTPTILGSTTAGTQTYSTQVGRWVQIGSFVLISGKVVMSAKDGTTAGNIYIGGIPFAAANEGSIVGGIAVGAFDNITLAGSYTQISVAPNSNAATLAILQSGSGVAAQLIQAAAIAATTGIDFAGIYKR